MHHRILQPPAPRRRLLIVGALLSSAAVLVVVSELWLLPWMQGYLSHPEPDVAREHAWHLTLGLAALCLSIAGWVLWTGLRVLRTRQWPLPGAIVLRPTPISEGRVAVLRGAAMVGVAIAEGAVALHFTFWFHSVLMDR